MTVKYGSMKYRMELTRQNFWFAIMKRFPRLYKRLEKLPIDTLPF